MIIKHSFSVDVPDPKRPRPKDPIKESINKQIIEASLNRGCGCQKKKNS